MACEFQIVAPVGKPGEFLPIGSGYGSRIDPITGATSDWHAGIDIPAPKFTPVRAAMDGTVAKSYISPSYGNTIWLNHGNGVQTRYAHLAYPGLYNEGELVRAGTQIGAVGSTGDSTGNHLHFEIRVNDQNIDPTECYNNSLIAYNNPYTIPEDYSGNSMDYTAPPPPSDNNNTWLWVIGGLTLATGLVIVFWPDNEEKKANRKRKRKA